MKSIVILASGRGSNAARIIEYFDKNENIRVSAIISDRRASGALELAKKNGIDAHYLPKQEIEDGGLSLLLESLTPDLIVLAGFLRKIPEKVVSSFPDAIINVHPALLPNHGGPGMYGNHVHTSVIEAGDEESGITIHYVNEEYDKGQVIAKFHCPVWPDDTIDSLSKRVQVLEHRYLPMIIHAILSL